MPLPEETVERLERIREEALSLARDLDDQIAEIERANRAEPESEPAPALVVPARMPLPERAPRKRTESTAQAEIIAALNRLPGVRVARNNVGRLQDRNGTWVSYGLGVGSPDIVGIYTMVFRSARITAHTMRVAAAFGVEVKSEKGRLRLEQELWRDAMIRRGLPTFLARSDDEAVRQVEAWCAEVDGAL